MIKSAALVILIALRLAYQPDWKQQGPAPFTSQPPLPTATIPAKLTSFNGSIQNNKVFLEWTVDENETADQFEIEKSVDGRNYRLAALVFGSDAPSTGKYQFYEKAGNQKIQYRIKLINKNKEAAYSTVVEIGPNA